MLSFSNFLKNILHYFIWQIFEFCMFRIVLSKFGLSYLTSRKLFDIFAKT